MNSLLDDLKKDIRSLRPQFPLGPIEKAFHLSAKLHENQVRKSGEPYIVHPVEVVRILLELHLDLPSLVAGLLHDTVEDTVLKVSEVEQEFGKEVAFLVDGVTKLSKLSFKSSHTVQAENFRKMIMAMGKDIRVILIKIADRLHNMRTLQFMSPEKQILIATETEEIYAPLAHRLGINWVKTELQDLCLRFLKPEVYFKLVQLVSQTKSSREKYIEDVIQILTSQLEKNHFKQFEISGRPKNFYSIYKKMEEQHLTFDQIHDLLAFRIICEDIRSCYQALGIIHSLYKPVPGRFKDYIAMPKANLYQSLHTTVVGPQGHRMEIQIRTFEMHSIAEFGIAAHWHYKEDGSVEATDVEKFSWIRRLVEQQEDFKDPSEFLDSLKLDLFEEEVFVFSPKGRVVALPYGSCAIDFAYSIHSEVGSRCVGAKVNGRLVPLRHRLESGDEVEILTSEGQTPRKDWLDFVVTSRARAKIRAHVKKAQRDESKALGEKLLDREFRKKKLNFAKLQKEGVLQKVASNLSSANEEDLLIKIGYGRILAAEVIKPVMKVLGMEVADEEPLSETLETDLSLPSKKSAERSPVIVEGIDNMLVRFARCCNPIPGEPIVGFVSRGKGISVHAAYCKKAVDLDPERQVDLIWDPGQKKRFKAGIKVITVDRPGMLAEITQVISSFDVNISNARVQMHADEKASILFEVALPDLAQLQRVLIRIEGIDGVISAERYYL